MAFLVLVAFAVLIALLSLLTHIGADHPWMCSCGSKMEVVERDGLYFARCPKCGSTTPPFRSIEALRRYEEGA